MNIERINSTKDLEIAIREDLYSLSREKSGSLFLALPGGRSAGYLVKALLTLPKDVLVRTHLFLIDERLEGERNEDTLMKAGLKTALAQGTTLSIVQEDIPLSAHPFDRLYLGVGEDGHVASLFPGSWPGNTEKQTMVVSESPKPPKRRVTLSYQGFLELAGKAKVYLLFIGTEKQEALQRLLSCKEDVQTLPCVFFARSPFHATIVTDLGENTT